jgi:hypothetical protein
MSTAIDLADKLAGSADSVEVNGDAGRPTGPLTQAGRIDFGVPAGEIRARAREAVNICLRRPGRYGPPVFPTP